MPSDGLLHIKTVLVPGAMALVLALGLCASFAARAGDHLVSLSKIFPVGKCSPVIPNFELMVAHFADGEMTEHKILNGQGEAIEVITTFINKERDQWATVGSTRDEKVIFCLYASGSGPGTVVRRAITSQ